MKILIIGGCGYIGTRLIDYLKEEDPSIEIVVIDTDIYSTSIFKRKDIEYIYSKYQDITPHFFNQFTDIILLAGQGSVKNSDNILNVIDNNVRNFAWLLDIINHDQKLIYASSSSIYKKTNLKEVDEKYNDLDGFIPYNYYDWSKQSIDHLIELSEKNVYSLRFGTVCGFSRNFRNDIMINSMCYNAIKDKKICISNPHINRPILGLKDLCKAFHIIINYGSIDKAGIYNLNSFNSNVNDIYSKVSNICNVPYEYINSNNNDPNINMNLNTKYYDFMIHSNKFKEAFNFEFNETTETIIFEIVNKWDEIENFQNRNNDYYKSYKMINNCRVCNNKTKSLLNFGEQPLANSYNKKYEINYDNKTESYFIEEKFPLHLHYCDNCYHTQLNCIVEPKKLFKNYIYISGTSKTLCNYFYDFAKNILQSFLNKNIDKNGIKEIKILEIACNDGNQLDVFHLLSKELNLDNIKITTVGVDPAENIYNNITSKKKEHDIYCDFFNQNTIDKLKIKYDNFDIIIGENVFAHIDYPSEFLNLCKKIMNDNTILYIQTSQKNMIIENQFDTVYHEHLSFFNVKSMNILCEKNDLFLNNIYENEIHGTSYIFEINKTKISNSNTKDMLLYEEKKGLYSEEIYKNYYFNCLKFRNDFSNIIINYKLTKKNIIAFGSTAKSMTLINFCNIDNNFIDYIIDENELKQGLYTPGSNILIRDIHYLKNILNNTVILITAWNFYNEIKMKIQNILKEYNIEYPVILININSLEEEIIN